MDGRAFAKLCRDCGLQSKLGHGAADVDLVFSRAARKPQKRLGLPEFRDALEDIAERLQTSPDYVYNKVAQNAVGGPVLLGTLAEFVRFHDDKETYTGVHKCGGPSSGKIGRGTATQLAGANMQWGH